MRFSLILATLRSTAELTRLLDSEQTHKDFVLIVVDRGLDTGGSASLAPGGCLRASETLAPNQGHEVGRVSRNSSWHSFTY